MKKTHLALTIIMGICTVTLCGCAGSYAAPVSESAVVQLSGPASSDDTGETAADAPDEPVSEDIKEDEHKADTFCDLSAEHDIETILSEYTVNRVEDGKFAGFEGDIGDVLAQYKDIDLTGDGLPDEIIRKKEIGEDGPGYYYEISLSDGDSLLTKIFSGYPGDGEVIEYSDIDGDGTDEILFTHYTDGSAGIMAWDIYLYHKNTEGAWEETTIADQWICLQDIADACGFILASGDEDHSHPEDEPYIRAAGLSGDKVVILIDHGMKSGPAIYTDYDVVTLEYIDGKLTLSDHSAEQAAEYWPKLEADADHPWGNDVVIEDIESCVEKSDERKLKDLLNAYCLAYMNADPMLVEKISDNTASDELLYTIGESQGYFSEFSDHKMYVAKGYRPDSYVAVVTYQVLLEGASKTYPEVEMWYICRNSNGGLYVNFSQLEGRESDYVDGLRGDEMADPIKRPDKLGSIYTDIGMVEYNQKVYSDPDLADLKIKMDDEVRDRVQKDLELNNSTE